MPRAQPVLQSVICSKTDRTVALTTELLERLDQSPLEGRSFRENVRSLQNLPQVAELYWERLRLFGAALGYSMDTTTRRFGLLYAITLVELFGANKVWTMRYSNRKAASHPNDTDFARGSVKSFTRHGIIR